MDNFGSEKEGKRTCTMVEGSKFLQWPFSCRLYHHPIVFWGESIVFDTNPQGRSLPMNVVVQQHGSIRKSIHRTVSKVASTRRSESFRQEGRVRNFVE